jgi:DNA-binding transcriptional ArsR family regulator
MKAMEGSEGSPINWGVVAPLLVHPVKVAVIEAHDELDRPLSSAELMRHFSRADMGLSRIAYHVRVLAELGILEKVSQRQVRGSVETFYRLR